MKDRLSSSPVHTAGNQYEHTGCYGTSFEHFVLLCELLLIILILVVTGIKRRRTPEKKSGSDLSIHLHASDFMSVSVGFRWLDAFSTHWTGLKIVRRKQSLGLSPLLCTMRLCTAEHHSDCSWIIGIHTDGV